MRISRQAQREAKALYRACLVDGRLDEGRVRTAVTETTKKKPRGFLGILARFARLVRLELERRQATVRSALPLAAGEQTALQDKLTGLYGPGLDFAFREEAGLIGGMRVQVGNNVFDGTIRARLEALRERF